MHFLFGQNILQTAHDNVIKPCNVVHLNNFGILHFVKTSISKTSKIVQELFEFLQAMNFSFALKKSPLLNCSVSRKYVDFFFGGEKKGHNSKFFIIVPISCTFIML